MADSATVSASEHSRHQTQNPNDAHNNGRGMDSPSSPSSSTSPQPNHQYLHPPLQVSFDSIPRNATANDLANISTPPIQQQESILNALAQTVAQEDQDSLDETHPDFEGSSSSSSSLGSEDETSQSTRRRRRRTLPSASPATAASSATFQDKGNGWALLTQPRSSASASTSTSTLPSSSTDRKRKRTRATTLNSTTDDMLAISSSHKKHPHQRPNPIRTSSPAISSPRSSRPSTPLTAGILLSGGPIDCDTPSRKSKDASSSFGISADGSSPSLVASDARARASISGASNKELPAEGSGLRGKDENKMVVDQELDEHRQRLENNKAQSASPFDGANAVRDPAVSETASTPAASSSSTAVATTTGTDHSSAVASSSSNPLNPPPARKLCIRHQRMADEGTVGKLQRVSTIDSDPFPSLDPSHQQVATRLMISSS